MKTPIRIAVLLLVLTGFVLFGYYLHPTTTNLLQGYVEGEYVYLSSTQSGRLTKVYPNEGVLLHQGEPIFDLDPTYEQTLVDEAKGQLDSAEHHLQNLLTGKRPEEIKALEEALNQARTELGFSEAEYKRAESLVKTRVMSVEQFQKARSDYERGKFRVSELEALLAVGRLPGREEEIKAAQADIEAAKGHLKQAEWKLEEKKIKSPIDALVTDVIQHEGNWVNIGDPVLQTLSMINIKARFYVPESLLGRIHLGDKVIVTCDGCHKPVEAKITYISPNNEYTPPVLYSREWRSKLVYLVEAKPEPETFDLKPGQPIDVELLDNAQQ